MGKEVKSILLLNQTQRYLYHTRAATYRIFELFHMEMAFEAEVAEIVGIETRLKASVACFVARAGAKICFVAKINY